MRRSLSILGIALAASIAGCAQPPGPSLKLSHIDALPKASLPPWIASISPQSQAQSLAQIRVIFTKPVTKVESLEGDGPQDVLSHLRVEPALDGRFVVLTPRMIGFVAGHALPAASRVRVTLTAGLRDLDGDTLGNDLAWTFDTRPLAFTNLPTSKVSDGEPTPGPVALKPALRVDANAPVDLSSLAAHAFLMHAGARVALDAKLVPTPSPLPGADAGEQFDDTAQSWTYELTPRGDLDRNVQYVLAIDPGVEPATGNVATTRTFAGDIRTFGALGVVSISSSQGRFANGDPVLVFSNPIDPKTIDGNITISPQPSPAPSMQPYAPNDATIGVAVDPYALDPGRDYTVTVGTGLKDVFGQSLPAAQTVSVHTGNFAPGMWAPSGTTVIPANAGVDLNFYATNLPGNRYRAAFAPVDPERVLSGLTADSILPSPPAAWPLQTLAGASINRQSVVRIPLQAQLRSPYGALAYGFFAPIGSDQGTSSTGLVQLTNLGIFAQWFPGRGSVMVEHLSDGAPVARAGIGLYRVGSRTTAPQACANGFTDANGEYDLTGIDLERCYSGARADTAPSLGVIAREGTDVATLTTFEWSGVYRYDVPSGWTGGAPLSRGTIFSDRQMYQPGERAQLTGIAYYVKGDAVLADRDAAYTLAVTDPSNAVVRRETVKTDRYGVFTMPIAFSKTQALGYYTINATGSNGNAISGSLRVAEFKPPNFKMSVSLSAKSAVSGSSVTANASAAYLFGAPLQGGKAHATVTRSFAQVAPSGWDDYTFGRQWFWPEDRPSITTDVLQQDLPLDASGAATLSTNVPADLPGPMTYEVDVEATDVSNLSVADSQSFLALPADGVIGLASETVGAAKAAMPIRVVVTDAAGKPIGARKIHVELQKMTYTSATQAQAGGESAQEAVKYDRVDSADVTSRNGPLEISLTPPDAGSYRVRANFQGAPDASATDMQVFAYGDTLADFGESTPSSVKITLDKKKYKTGERATALIGSPFERADVYFSVVRSGVLYSTTLHDVAGAPHVSFVVTPQMLPNAAVQAFVVRRGPKLAQIKPGSLDSLSRVGLAAFNVDLSDRYLKLAISPRRASLAPGAGQNVDFVLRDARGGAARGKIVAMAVNESILQLSGYRLPDLVQTVFDDQPISTRFADNRENLTLQTPKASAEKGFGYGGGFLAGAAGTRVRTNFLPLAYFGSVVTDDAGHAAVSFNVPDDLTTWRVMAVAIGDDDAHFGTSDATFVTTLPLMVNPLLPQFARPGDQMDVGASVMNQTGAAGGLDLRGTVTGALAFANGADVRTAQTQNAGLAGYRYPVTVGTPAPSSVAFAAVLGSARDAFTVPFEVTQRSASESVIESGATAGSADVPVKFDRPGSLQVTVANSVVPQFVTPASRTIADDGVGLADSYASRLIVASSLGTLAPKYRLHLDFDPKTLSESALHGLLALQHGDGGFASFTGARGDDPYGSAYALEALAFGSAHGVAVDPAPVAKARAFARDVLASPSRYRWCSSDSCKAQLRFAMLYALAQSGDRRSDFMPQIYAQLDSFDSATQIRLARYMLTLPDWRAQGAALADRLQQSVYVTGRYAVAGLDLDWGWFGSQVSAQAEMLQLLLDRHAAPEETDGAVRALIAQQCACGWPTIDMTAAAVRALDAYASHERLSRSRATVTVGSQTLGTASFGATASSQTFQSPTQQLRGNAVSIRSSGGNVHYIVLYTYAPASDAPGVLTAFRITRSFSDVGAASPRATMDLAPVSTPVAADAGRVFYVGLRIAVDHAVDRLVLEDPLPAGLEAVDANFQTSNKSQVAQSDSWQIDDRQIYRDRVTAFAQHLQPGIYEMHYLVRSVTPGRYGWPGARVYLQDAPEQLGRTASTVIEVK